MLAAMKRLDSLDGLRGLLAFYVLLGHMAPFAVLPDWTQDAVSHGGAAVDIFFVLSGLVITQSLQRAGGQAVPFLVARFARIFPVFLAVFAVAIVVAPWSCGFEQMPWIGPDDAARTICVKSWPTAWLPEIAAHLTMTHGLFPNAVWPGVWLSFLGAAWSLSTEWQFYLLALLVAGRSRRLCWFLLGMAVVGTAWRLTAPMPWQFSRAFLPNKAHFFALGVASVAVVRSERGALARYTLVLIASLAICAIDGSPGKILPPMVWTFCLAVQMRPDVIGLRQAERPAAQPTSSIPRGDFVLSLFGERADPQGDWPGVEPVCRRRRLALYGVMDPTVDRPAISSGDVAAHASGGPRIEVGAGGCLALVRPDGGDCAGSRLRAIGGTMKPPHGSRPGGSSRPPSDRGPYRGAGGPGTSTAWPRDAE